MDGSWAGAVATGCYDGSARLWSPGGALLCSLAGHDGAVTAVSLLPPPSIPGTGAAADAMSSASGCTVVGGGHDGTVRTWDVAMRGGAATLNPKT